MRFQLDFKTVRNNITVIILTDVKLKYRNVITLCDVTDIMLIVRAFK